MDFTRLLRLLVCLVLSGCAVLPSHPMPSAAITPPPPASQYWCWWKDAVWTSGEVWFQGEVGAAQAPLEVANARWSGGLLEREGRLRLEGKWVSGPVTLAGAIDVTQHAELVLNRDVPVSPFFGMFRHAPVKVLERQGNHRYLVQRRVWRTRALAGNRWWRRCFAWGVKT